jgi:hypothetical protein
MDHPAAGLFIIHSEQYGGLERVAAATQWLRAAIPDPQP